MISEAVAEMFERDETGKGAIGSGYTYSGHPVGAAAAIACLQETERLKVNENAAARGAEMMAGLEALAKKHELIGDVRGGQGLMNALELISDRANKTPLDIHAAIYADGVMVRISGPNVILSPPLVVTSKDIAKIVSALDVGLSAA